MSNLISLIPVVTLKWKLFIFEILLLSTKVFIVIMLDYLEKIFKAKILLPHLLSQATASLVLLSCYTFKNVICLHANKWSNYQETRTLFCHLRVFVLCISPSISHLGSAWWFQADTLEEINAAVHAVSTASPVMQAMNSSPEQLLATPRSPPPSHPSHCLSCQEFP